MFVRLGIDPAFQDRDLAREDGATSPRRIQRVTRAARLEVHGQQPELLWRTGKHLQLHAAAHIVVHREVEELWSARERQSAPNGKAIVLYGDATRETELIVMEQEARRIGAVDLLERHD